MNIRLPPPIRADLLVLRRAGWSVPGRWLLAPALLVAACCAVACIPRYGGPAWWTAAGAVFAAAGSFALVRSRLTGALVRARLGWCGALPVSTGAIRWNLVALAVAAWVVGALLATLLPWLAALFSSQAAGWGFAALAVDGGLLAGTLVAAVAALRPGVAMRTHHTDGIREPLFAWPWLNDRRLPHLLDWQRRAALVRWRRGGSFVVVGAALAVVPNGAAIPAVLALVLWVAACAWLAVVLRSCADTTVDAVRLLAAQPHAAASMRFASLRYPLLALPCALVVAAAAPVSGGRFALGVFWGSVLVAGCIGPLLRIMRATGSRSPW